MNAIELTSAIVNVLGDGNIHTHAKKVKDICSCKEGRVLAADLLERYLCDASELTE
jgi:hypothetical protein